MGAENQPSPFEGTFALSAWLLLVVLNVLVLLLERCYNRHARWRCAGLQRARCPQYNPKSKGRPDVYLAEEELMRDDGTELPGKGMEGGIEVPQGWLGATKSRNSSRHRDDPQD